jgi:hypothetical protein
MRLRAAFERYWFEPAPARRLALLRILSGGFALVHVLTRFPSLTAVAHFEPSQFVPTGLVALLPGPLPSSVVIALVALTLLASVPFVLGMLYRFTAPVFALLFLWVTSYRSSWGMLFHTENLLALHLVVLAAAPAADALSWDARRRAPRSVLSGAYGWAARAMSATTAVCYVLAGLAKLKLAGPIWLEGDLLRAQIAYDNLRKIELGGSYSALGAALVHYETPFLVLAIMTVALELGAPLALFGRRIALVWALAAWAFHIGIEALMAIPFPYQLSFVAYASLFEVERAFDFIAEHVRRRFAERAPEREGGTS